MDHTQTPCLYSERLFHRIIHLIVRYRYVLLGTFIFGCLAHMFIFTNKLPNQDDLKCLFTKGVTIQSGRWGLEILSYLFPDVSMPWIYGMLSLTILAIANCILVRVFDIKNGYIQFLMGGIIISFPSQTGVFTYLFTASAYSVSFLLAVLSTALIRSTRKRDHLFAVLCLIGSLSIYQAYLSITASVLIVLLINDVLSNRHTPKELFTKGIFYVLFLIVALGLYWVVTKILLSFLHTGFGEYAQNALNIGPSTILDGIKNAYISFYRTLRFRDHGLISSMTSFYVHFLCLGVSGIELLSYIIRTKDIYRIVLLLFLLAVLPLGIGCLYLFSQTASIHTLVLFSYISLYLLFAAVLGNEKQCVVKNVLLQTGHTLCREVIAIGMALIIVCNVYAANKLYLSLHLSYENTYSFTTSVITQLHSTPGYSSESKIAVIGKYDSPSFYSENLSDLNILNGILDVSPNVYSFSYFFEYYNGVPLEWASKEECASLETTKEFDQMPSYPEYGYIRQIDDIFVIKLG